MSLSSPSGPIGYVLKRYPRFSETFVVNEILAHEAAGQPIEIFALRSVEETHFQDLLGRVRAPVTRIPDRFSGPEPFWTRLAEVRDELPAAWETLARMDAIACGRNVAQALELALQIRRRGVSHLHAHFGTVATSVARLAAAMAGIGYSFTAHAKDIYYDYDEPQHLDAKLQDAAFSVTVSDFNVAYLKDTFGAERVSRIYNGLDLGHFAYQPPRAEAREIIAVGRLVEKKGFHILIEALRLMAEGGRPVSCRIVGAGEEREHLISQIEDAGLPDRVTLDGPRPQSEVIEMMRQAAVLACPCVVGSDGNRDGLPTVLLEAMALGLPVVTTDVVGIPELVRDGDTGLLVAEGDPQALAEALERALDDGDLRTGLSQRARALIEEEFDVQRSAAALRALFDQAILERADRKAA